MAGQDAPKDSSVEPSPPIHRREALRASRWDKAPGGPPFSERTFAKTVMAGQDASGDSSIEPGPPTARRATLRASRSSIAPGGPPFSERTYAKTVMAFQSASHPLGVQPIPLAEGSSVAGTPEPKEAAAKFSRGSAARFEPFKEIIHKLYVVEGYSLSKVMSIMELQHQLTRT